MDIRSLQKIRFFLGAIFPSLARDLPRSKRVDAWLERNPKARARFERMQQSRVARNLQQANENFGTGHYAGGVLDWNAIPTGTVAVLRAGVILATLLCVLVPVAMKWPLPPIATEAISGYDGPPVAGWSILLWMLGAALGWGCVVVGSGTSNRLFFVPAVIVFFYFDAATVGAAGRSWWNLAVTFAILVAVVYAEGRATAARPDRRWLGFGLTVAGAMVAGVAGVALSPIGNSFRGYVLWVGSGLGVPLGVLLWWLGRWIGRRSAADFADASRMPLVLRPDVAVAAVTLLQLVFVGGVAIRGGLTTPAAGLHGLAVQATGYLWPLFYFIGVGIVFRLLRQARFIHGTVRDLVPAPVFVGLGFVFLVVGTVVMWSDGIVSDLNRWWPPGVAATASWTYAHTGWIWSRPIWAMSAEWVRWIFLIALFLAGWAAVRRRLTSETMAAILFPTVLLWLAVFEYFFEFTSFSRSPMHSATSLLAFAIFVLWLAHLTMRPFLTGGSAWWSGQARVVLYVAGLMFVLLPVHVRAAMHDAKLANEIFLMLFFGIIDVGVPFYLYLYATRRFQRLPLSVGKLLAFFGVGALLAVAFTILDKLAVMNWSVGVLGSTVEAQVQAMLTVGRWDQTPVFLPRGWVVMRSVLVIGAIVGTAFWVRRRHAARDLAPAAVVFAVMAMVTGLASFSNRALELPLMPNFVLQLITPMHASQSIDSAVVARFCAFLIPALIVPLCLSGAARARTVGGGIAVAWLVHLGATWLWPAEEPWLRSAGWVTFLGTSGLLAVVVLVLLVRDRLDVLLETKPGVAEGNLAQVLPPRQVAAVATVLMVGFFVWGGWQASGRSMVERRILETRVAVALPEIWTERTGVAGGPAVFDAPSTQPLAPMLTIAIQPCPDGDTRVLLQGMVDSGAAQMANFYAYATEDWARYHAGAVALEYQFERPLGEYTATVMGTVVVVPLGPGQALVYNVLYQLSDRERRWDIVRALQQSGHRRD